MIDGCLVEQRTGYFVFPIKSYQNLMEVGLNLRIREKVEMGTETRTKGKGNCSIIKYER